MDYVIFLIFAGIDILLGYLIKKYSLANILIGYEAHRHDPVKFSRIGGNNLLGLGLCLILSSIILLTLPQLLALDSEQVSRLAKYCFGVLHLYFVGSFYYKVLVRKKADVIA